jgi:hypothetical protein
MDNIPDISPKGRLFISNDAASATKTASDYHIVARSELKRNEEHCNKERRDHRNDKHHRIVQ